MSDFMSEDHGEDEESDKEVSSDAPAPAPAANGPEGGAPPTEEEEELIEAAPRTEVEERAAAHAEKNAHDVLTRGGYTPTAPHPGDVEPNALGRRTTHPE